MKFEYPRQGTRLKESESKLPKNRDDRELIFILMWTKNKGDKACFMKSTQEVKKRGLSWKSWAKSIREVKTAC